MRLLEIIEQWSDTQFRQILDFWISVLNKIDYSKKCRAIYTEFLTHFRYAFIAKPHFYAESAYHLNQKVILRDKIRHFIRHYIFSSLHHHIIFLLKSVAYNDRLDLHNDCGTSIMPAPLIHFLTIITNNPKLCKSYLAFYWFYSIKSFWFSHCKITTIFYISQSLILGKINHATT